MKKIFTSLAALITAIMVVIITDYDKAEKQSEAWVEPTTISTTDDVTTETSVTTSTTSTTTTTTDTTSSTSTTTTSTTTTTTTTTTIVATTEYIEIEETVLVEEEYYQTYDETVDTVTEEEIYYEETQSNNMTINYTINELTYYSSSSGCCGRWGRILLNNYSVASNLLPDGTIVHIESSDGSICGDYRVDDTGGMGNNVIDIFYTDYANVPYTFARDGRISCTVWVYE